MDSGGEDAADEKRQSHVSSTAKKNTESLDIEKRLKKEIARDLVQVKRCCLLTARSVEAGISIYS